MYERPNVLDRYPDIEEDLAKYRIAGPALLGDGLNFSFMIAVVVCNHPHGWLRYDESCSAISESRVVSDIGGRSEIVRFRMVHASQIRLQCRPEDGCVAFGENVPLHVWILVERPVHHGDELPFVELPPRDLRMSSAARRLREIAAQFALSQGSSAVLFDASVQLEIAVVGHNVWVDQLESVQYTLAEKSLCVIRKYDMLRSTLQGGRKVSWDPVCDLCNAGPKNEERFQVCRMLA